MSHDPLSDKAKVTSFKACCKIRNRLKVLMATATCTQAGVAMTNNTVLKVFLLLYLVTRGLASIGYQHNFTSPLPQCANNNLSITKESDFYTLELNSNLTWNITEQFVECGQQCRYSIHLHTGETITYACK